jgi:hypothetical protein
VDETRLIRPFSSNLRPRGQDGRISLDHRIEIEAAGYRQFATTVSVRPGTKPVEVLISSSLRIPPSRRRVLRSWHECHYVTSGQMAADYPDLTGFPIRVVVVSTDAVPEGALILNRKIMGLISPGRISIEVRQPSATA